MLEVGNGGLTDAQSRTHFGLWALAKAPLILGTALPSLSPSQLAIVSNRAVIAINQDALGVQGRKLAVDGARTARFAGLAPCLAPPTRGFNGVSAASLQWRLQPSAAGGPNATQLFNVETQRCLAMAPYSIFPLAPLLFPCNVSDPAQAWLLPTGAGRLGALLWAPAALAGAPAALTVAEGTLHTGAHGPDAPLPDANYALSNITLSPYAPEPPCTSRNCEAYAPEQTFYYSARTGKIFFSHFAANHYRCWTPNCERGTTKLPTGDNYCLAHVASIVGSVGTSGGGGGGTSVWGGPLAGGDVVLALVNQLPQPANVSARLEWLELPGMGDATQVCGTELFTNATTGPVTGGLSLLVPGQDIAMLRMTAC